jgi:uncharacterized membrane protein YhdT
MRIAKLAVVGIGIIVIFILTAVASQVMSWPRWLTMVVYIGLFVGLSWILTKLTMTMLPARKDQEDDDND